MITIFAVPKPFDEQFNVIQRNAIGSWLKLKPKCEIILLGNEKGVAEFASEFGIKHISNVALSKFGTPLVPDVFEKAIEQASHKIVAYLNADIILLQDFMEAFFKINLPLFLMGGQRTDVEFKESINFNDPDWAKKIKNFAEERGHLHGVAGMDYFVFPSSIPFNFPSNFAAGRPGGDNWTVYRTKFLKIPFIDATPAIMAIHPNHKHYFTQGETDRWEGPESKENQKLAGGKDYVFTLSDADLIITKNGIRKPSPTIARLARHFETLPVLRPDTGKWPKIISLILRPKRLAGAILRNIKSFF